MTIEDVQAWCRANRIDARGFIRGGEFFVRHGDGGPPASQPAMTDILHWEVTINSQSYPSSPSDMERLVTGKMDVETFIQMMGHAARRGGE